MYNPITIANYFIYKSIDEGIEMTPMKVLKLVYIAHGWNLGLRTEPLIEEQVEAWKYGPVIESVYQTFKKFGNNDINSLQNYEKERFEELKKSENDKNLVDKVWDVYKDYSGLELSTLTHQKGTPWYITWNEKGGSLTSGAIIPNSLIQEYYKQKAEKNKKN